MLKLSCYDVTNGTETSPHVQKKEKKKKITTYSLKLHYLLPFPLQR